MDILHFLSMIGLGVLLLAGVWLLFMLAVVRTIHAQHNVEATLSQTTQDQTIKLLVETAGDQLLCYNATTMDFVCQGSTADEIKTRFRQRFPGKSAAVVAGDEHALTLLKQQLKHQNSI